MAKPTENLLLDEHWVSKALKKVKVLGKKLTKNTKNHKYPFKASWLFDLIERYSQKPGNPLVHLEDLPDKVCIYISDEGKRKIREAITKIYPNYSETKLLRILGYGLIYYLKGKQRSISLGVLKRTVRRLNLQLEDLEKNILYVKPSSSSKVIRVKFPLNLVSREGAIILGCFPDVGILRYSFYSKDRELVEEFREAAKKLLGEFKDEEPKKDSKNRYKYYATNFLRDVCDIAGYDATEKQIVGNNPIPLWIFLSPHDFLRVYLQKLWDTDGSVGNDKLKFAQSTAFSLPFDNFLELSSIAFGKIPARFKGLILKRPPLLLVSMQLLLTSMGIISRIYPERVKSAKDELIHCEWSLRITSYRNINAFAEKINFGLKRKRKKLETLLSNSGKRIIRKERKYMDLLRAIKRRGCIKTKDASKVLNLSLVSGYNYLNDLIVRGLVYREEKRLIQEKYGPRYFIYVLTKEGREFTV